MDPLSYSDITLASSFYKAYCWILNERLKNYVERNNILVDEQNGFRKKRSIIDQVFSLTSIIETRKKCKLSTYTALIEFRKASATINRPMFWQRLNDIRITGKMHSAVKSLYTGIQFCILFVLG